MTEKNSSFTSNYAADLYTEGVVCIPYLLLRNYAKLGINEAEVVLILQIIALQQYQKEKYPLPEDLSKLMAIDSLTVKSHIASLIEKGLLTVERKYNYESGEWDNVFSLNLLFDKLAEIWAFERAKSTEHLQLDKKTTNANLAQLYNAFEKEFGRLLSPMETSQLLEWHEGEAFSVELILEALKRAVLRGILNFKYIDSILQDWSRNKIKTVKQAVQYEEHFKQKPNENNKNHQDSKIKQKKEKYKDIYLS